MLEWIVNYTKEKMKDEEIQTKMIVAKRQVGQLSAENTELSTKIKR